MTISFVGDISLNGINEKDFSIDSQIVDVFSNSNLVSGNLENPITNSNSVAQHAVVNLKSNEKTATKFIKYFDVVSLCNNHMFDYGKQGYNDTIEFLQKNKIHYFGAGKSQYEAQKPFIFQNSENQKIAIIGGKLMSGPRWPDAIGNNYGTSGIKGLKKIIKNLKEDNHFVIYYPHWGYEYIKTPPPNIRRHAKRMINLGVDLIIGSHPHVLQGYENYKNKYIFYSIGNFIFNVTDIKKLTIDKYYQQTTQSVILNLKIENNELVKFDLLPIKFSDNGVYLAEQNERQNIIDDVNAMSAIFHKNYLKYCYKYYSQTPDIQRQNQRIYKKFDSVKVENKQTTIQKIKLMSMQGVLNRIAAKIFTFTGK